MLQVLLAVLVVPARTVRQVPQDLGVMMVPLVLLASPDLLAALDLPDLRVIAVLPARPVLLALLDQGEIPAVLELPDLKARMVLPALPVPQALKVMMVLQVLLGLKVTMVLPELASLDQLARPEQPEPLVRLVPLVLPDLPVL